MDRNRKIHFLIATGGFLGGSPTTQRQKPKRGEKSFFIIQNLRTILFRAAANYQAYIDADAPLF
jgi:hypothetical protein